MWSAYQEAVFDFIVNGTGHACIEAVAGSGKSTTGIESAKRFLRLEQGMFASFTRTIIEDLDSKLKAQKLHNISARTYNSFGAGLVHRYMNPRPKLLTGNGEKTLLVFEFDVRPDKSTFLKCKNSMIRLVSLLKNMCFLSAVDAEPALDNLFEYYGIDIPRVTGFKELLLETYDACLRRHDIMDWDDQKLFPVLFNWPVPQLDFLIIDEFQDNCALESELMLRACHGGRVLVFGDSNQAIYSFKGTTPDSMAKFAQRFAAKKLPLSISYRCPKYAIAQAKLIVPHIEAAPGAIEGFGGTIDMAKFRRICLDGDMVLGRVTQDLAASVTAFLAEGRAAYVEGKEYGTLLKYFIEKINPPSNTSADVFYDALKAFYSEQHAELSRRHKENQVLVLEVQYETIDVLIPGCRTISDLHRKIDSIFTDKGRGIRHLTVHKSKGLECDNVFILRPDRFPHPRAKLAHMLEEEMRLKYVALTRTKRSLFRVTK